MGRNSSKLLKEVRRESVSIWKVLLINEQAVTRETHSVDSFHCFVYSKSKACNAETMERCQFCGWKIWFWQGSASAASGDSLLWAHQYCVNQLIKWRDHDWHGQAIREIQ